MRLPRARWSPLAEATAEIHWQILQSPFLPRTIASTKILNLRNACPAARLMLALPNLIKEATACPISLDATLTQQWPAVHPAVKRHARDTSRSMIDPPAKENAHVEKMQQGRCNPARRGRGGSARGYTSFGGACGREI